MSFLGHLEELRWRLFRSSIVVLLFAIFIFIYRKPLMDVIYMSMSHTDFVTYEWFCILGQKMGIGDELCANDINLETVSISMTAQFSATIFFALVGGLVCAFPYIAYQIWSFVKPALRNNEKQASRGFLPYAILLFFIGTAFGYFIISPLCVQFFANWRLSDEITNIPTITSYMSIITTSTFFTALLFELPIISYILAKVGLISSDFLKKYRRHAIVIILILSAIITPPDFFSQIIVGIPVMMLYEISIMVTKRVERKKE